MYAVVRADPDTEVTTSHSSSIDVERREEADIQKLSSEWVFHFVDVDEVRPKKRGASVTVNGYKRWIPGGSVEKVRENVPRTVEQRMGEDD